MQQIVSPPKASGKRRKIDPKSIFVGNLDANTTESDLRAFFKPHLQPSDVIERATVQYSYTDRETNRRGAPLGYAFVQFSNPEATKRALALDSSTLHNCVLKIKPKYFSRRY